MRNIPHRLLLVLLLLAGWGAAGALAAQSLPGGPAVNQLNLHPPATAIAVEQHSLHWMMLWLCSVIFVGVFSVMFYSIWKHRKSRGHEPATFHESVAVEVTWTVIPFILVILITLPATKALVAQKDTTNPDVTIKVTGYQWKWGYEYLNGEGQGIAFISTLDSAHRAMSDAGNIARRDLPPDYLLKVDQPMVVPVGKKVRIITTAQDVIHSFMVPAFGIKQDAIPGFVRDTWLRAERTGDFYGQCAELCGKEHAYMPIHVRVVPAGDYSAWVEQELKKAAAKLDDPGRIWTLEEILPRGERVYAANCAACHLAAGTGAGAIKPLAGSPVVLNADTSVQLQILLHGAADGAMPAWNSLSDTDLAAVATYTKNAWSNQTGRIVQPAEVQQERAR